MVALLGLAIGTGTMQATNAIQLTTSTVNPPASPTSVTLTCDTATGQSPSAGVTIIVTPVTAITSGTIAVTLGSLPSGVSK